MKKLFSLACLVIMIASAHAQNTFPSSGAVGIGTTTPNSSSLLDVTSTTKGILIPRMTKTQRDAIVSPVQGLMIFQTNSTPGFYYYDGTWKSVSKVKADLSNLSATAINMSLIPEATGTLDLGSSSLKWRDAYVSNIKFADGTTMSTASGGGGGIGGSGTANYLPKFTASTTLGNSLWQDNGSAVYVGSSLYALGSRMSVENLTTTRDLYLVNASTASGDHQGILNWVQTTGTGNKLGIKNQVWQTTGGTGTVHGVYNDLQNWGTGIGYGVYNSFDLSGSAANYGVYTTMLGGTGYNYGTWNELNGSGTEIGTYNNITGGINQYGAYTVLSGGTGVNFGYYVTSTGTSGTHYGLFSQVSTSNSLSYSAYLVGKVYCANNVGIGTTSPATKLHIVDGGTSGATANSNADLVVEDNTKAYINILTPDANESGILFGTPTSSADGGVVFNASSNSKGLQFRTGGNSTKMTITSAGDVCINTGTPATGYKLSVYGKIMCEELKVQLHANWPDYVFDESYSMPSITELRSFVNEHKHLPGIPSAAEMQEQGISVGDMQTKMMQKIEELSLYVIQLQNQIDELKAAKN